MLLWEDGTQPTKAQTLQATDRENGPLFGWIMVNEEMTPPKLPSSLGFSVSEIEREGTRRC